MTTMPGTERAEQRSAELQTVLLAGGTLAAEKKKVQVHE
jgi:hypothetical protein